jgi:hypothetical protein
MISKGRKSKDTFCMILQGLKFLLNFFVTRFGPSSKNSKMAQIRLPQAKIANTLEKTCFSLFGMGSNFYWISFWKGLIFAKNNLKIAKISSQQAVTMAMAMAMAT